MSSPQHARSGQSLIDVLVASGVAAILLVGALAVLTPALRGSTDAQYAQTGASVARGMQDAVRSAAASNWSLFAGLSQGSSNRYYLAAQQPVAVVSGTESLVFDGASGLVARWSLDEQSSTTAYTSVGTTHGTITGGATASTTCPIVGCRYFDGTDDRITITSTSTLNPSAITIAGWYRMNGTGGIALNKEGQYRILATDVHATKFALRYATASTGWASGTVTGSSTLAIGTWYHLVATYDGTRWVLYVNGVEDGSRAETGALATGSSDLYIGSYGAGYYFNGGIDDVRIYNRALTAIEVQQLYTAPVYTRNFYLSPINRTSGGAITTSGGYTDVSSLQLTVSYQWPRGAARILNSYLTRSRSNAFVQSDWAGGGGLTTPTTTPGNQYGTSSNIAPSTQPGGFIISL